MSLIPQKFFESRRRLATRLEELLRRGSGDDGFTMIEMIVALLIIGIVMAAFSTFFITTVTATTRQSSSQAATQLGDDAIERARAIAGSALLNGRDKTSSDTQWNNPVAGVSGYLADSVEAYNPAASAGQGATAPLPTTYRQATVNNIVYNQNWYIGKCWQSDAGGACTATTDDVPFFRVIVAVTWSDKRCATSVCSYVTTTLISGVGSEPLFLANGTAQPPAVGNPGTQTSDMTVADSVQMTATTGAPTIVWSATGLPPGLGIDPVTGLITGTPTTAGTYSVKAIATDGFGLIGSASYTWTVNAVPSLANPGTQTVPVGQSFSEIPSLTGGSPSFTWAATGLPAGLSVDSSSGIISGTPTAVGSSSVKLTATDGLGLATSATFTITVVTPLVVTDPPDQSGAVGSALTALQFTASGGSPGYTWAATGLPTGTTISASGKVTGTPSAAGTFTATITATDSGGYSSSVTVKWTIAAKLTATDPPDQTGEITIALPTLTLVANGGTGGYTWTATGLPAGVSIPAGTSTVTGTPTASGTFTATITVTDSSGATSSVTVKWTITAPTITAPTGNRTNARGAVINLSSTATGGSGSYPSWSATNLPSGLSINSSTGKITGTISGTAKGYSTTITVKDSLGVTSTVAFTWTVT